MATIKAIEGRSIHQIQSGQVIVDLTSVVKELVENSLDAGATSIDIRFKNQGLDTIEVQDNGKGISSEDFHTLALKHYTSKLSDFEDLDSLQTFGFRGEALSSLCALSGFHVVTARVEDGAVGKRLDFHVSGKLKGTSVVAAQKGTTVAVENLFHNLPVRRKELEKNIKREYNKAIGLLNSYACISVGVRFAFSNQMPKGKKVIVFSTKSNATTRENIANVFGAKMLSGLIEVDLVLEMDTGTASLVQSVRKRSTQTADPSRKVHIEGHISRPVFGEGRQTPDRQLYYVNSRPCALPQVSKVFNEVYKSFNVSQSPFVFANLKMDTNAYDVNISPDKRAIMLHDQPELLESLRAALTELFEQTDHSVPQAQLPTRKVPTFQPLTLPKRTSTELDMPNEDKAAVEESESEIVTVNDGFERESAQKAPFGLISNWASRNSNPRQEQGRSNQEEHSELSKDKRTMAERMRKSSADQEHTSELEDSVQVSPNETEETSPTKHPGAMHKEALHEYEKFSDIQMLTQDSPPAPLSTSYQNSISKQRSLPLTHENTAPSVGYNKSTAHINVVATAGSLETSRGEAPNDEQRIPAVALITPKSAPGPVANAFDRMRPKRNLQETAEITIGDRTITTVVGTTSAFKRRRIHIPKSSASAKDSPALRSLRGFAAPGSQLDIDNDDVSEHSADDEAEEEEDEGSQMSNDEVDETESNPQPNEVPDCLTEIALKSVPANELPTTGSVELEHPESPNDGLEDGDYVDEDEKKRREDEKVAKLIQQAEAAAVNLKSNSLQRAAQRLKSSSNRKDATINLTHFARTTCDNIKRQAEALEQAAGHTKCESKDTLQVDSADSDDAERKLSLTVGKPDFDRMLIVGQFNLGFILAVRPAVGEQDQDELFIIDQHAADEKFNYERFRRTLVLESQRLVRPKTLELTAVEEEIALNHEDVLKANGFEVEVSYSDEDDTQRRHIRLNTLPMSRDKTFDTSDLEELLHLLSEVPGGTSEILRPRKVQRMLAMRACRSSIMVGKTLTTKQMQTVVRHMGEMEKPWNCPHGRPTMRHLAGLGAWDGWQEGDWISDDDIEGGSVQSSSKVTNWNQWLAQHR